MKVVAINGSPRKGGNCAQMLEVLGKVLEQEGIEFEAVSYTHLTLPTIRLV